MTRQYDLDAIIQDLRNELDEADQKWGDQFDELNTLSDWGAYINIYVGQALRMGNKDNPHEVYRQLIKAMGLCASAAGHVVEELIAPRHFDTTLGAAQADRSVKSLARGIHDGIINAYAGGPVERGDMVAEVSDGVIMEHGERLRAAADSAMRIEEASYTECDISDEQTRMYEFGTGVDRYRHVIVEPRTLVFRHGGSTHRVIDSEGVVHCVPAPGHQACVLTWYPKDPSNPIQF